MYKFSTLLRPTLSTRQCTIRRISNPSNPIDSLGGKKTGEGIIDGNSTKPFGNAPTDKPFGNPDITRPGDPDIPEKSESEPIFPGDPTIPRPTGPKVIQSNSK